MNMFPSSITMFGDASTWTNKQTKKDEEHTRTHTRTRTHTHTHTKENLVSAWVRDLEKKKKVGNMKNEPM